MTLQKPAPRRTMTEHEIRNLIHDTAEKAAEEAVKKTLLTIGISTAEPLELQKDMQHLREWRQSVSTIKKQGLITMVAVITAGILGAIWLMIRGPNGS